MTRIPNEYHPIHCKIWRQPNDDGPCTCGTMRPQRQDNLTDQIKDLIRLANQHGMYDAADHLARTFKLSSVG